MSEPTTTAPTSRNGEISGWPKLVMTYPTAEGNIAPLLPAGLEPTGDNTVTVGIYCVPIHGEPEYGVSIKVPARWNGVDGLYNLGMGIDQEAAVFISAERNGQPKYLCDIDYYRLGSRVGARATHQGYTFVEYQGEVTGEAGAPAGDWTEHEWWTKYSREIGGGQGYDLAPVVVDVATTMETIHVETLDGELRLLDSPWDPVSRYLPMAGPATATLVTNAMKSRNISNAGPLDPDAFWNHADVIGGSRWPGESGGPRY
jgi:acetoacetate decarboxylase